MIADPLEYLRLVQSDDLATRQRCRDEPAADEVWLYLIEKHEELHATVAMNRTVSPAILHEIACRGDWRARVLVAGIRRTNTDTLYMLARDSDETIRAAVAGNAEVPSELMRLLAEDSSPWVRSKVEEARRRREERKGHTEERE